MSQNHERLIDPLTLQSRSRFYFTGVQGSQVEKVALPKKEKQESMGGKKELNGANGDKKTWFRPGSNRGPSRC